jgi:hypothetical protein
MEEKSYNRPQTKGIETHPHEFEFPIVLTVQSSLIGLDLIPIQQMSQPSGLLYCIDYIYEENTTK